jgi:hypothetical protein
MPSTLAGSEERHKRFLRPEGPLARGRTPSLKNVASKKHITSPSFRAPSHQGIKAKNALKKSRKGEKNSLVRPKHPDIYRHEHACSPNSKISREKQLRNLSNDGGESVNHNGKDIYLRLQQEFLAFFMRPVKSPFHGYLTGPRPYGGHMNPTVCGYL